MCFVAMPYGKRAANVGAPEIDFDAVYKVLETTVESTGLECVRADFEVSGGFVHKQMFERLIVSEYVLADMTFANPNVTYELGLRHGATIGATLLVGEEKFVKAKNLPFDFAPFRVLTYSVGADGRPESSSVQAFADALRKHLALARRGELPIDNPVAQLTQLRPNSTGHEKTEIFLARMHYASDIARRASEAIASSDQSQALSELDALAEEALAPGIDLRELHTSLMAIYLGYRAKSAFDRMIDLSKRMPRELRETPVAREQLALALNRMAERAAELDDGSAEAEFRSRSFLALDGIAKERWTSETYGILGRIHKGKGDTDLAADRLDEAAVSFTAAIEAYEQGLRSDPRDYYPGVNAVTLRIVRNEPEDAAALNALVPVVRFSVERAPEPKTNDERYWLMATKLELAAAARDWSITKRVLRQLLVTPGTQNFMRHTTCKNLRLQATARKNEPETVKELEHIIAALST